MRLSVASTILASVTATAAAKGNAASTDSDLKEFYAMLSKKSFTSRGNNNNNNNVDMILQLARQNHNDRSNRRKLSLSLMGKRNRGLTSQFSTAFNPGRILKNQPDAGLECDPTETTPSLTASSSRNDGAADVGILTCGVGQYCMESEESTLGGICVVNKQDSGKEAMVRDLLDELDNTMLDGAELLCMGGEDGGVLDDLSCDTCDVNTAEYTASIDCTVQEESCYSMGNLCNQNSIEFCTSQTIDGIVSGEDDYSYKICYSFTKPEDFIYCVSYTSVPDGDLTCEMEIEGVTCNSCTLMFKEQKWCRHFDCSNTPLPVNSTICDYDVMEAFSAKYLYDQLPCPDGCNLCGEDEYIMYKPSKKSLDVPGVGSFNCLQAQLTAMTGDFTSEQCTALQMIAYKDCDCQEAPPTVAPATKSSAGSVNNLVAAAVAGVTAIAALVMV
jgi:hypothetical protein